MSLFKKKVAARELAEVFIDAALDYNNTKQVLAKVDEPNIDFIVREILYLQAFAVDLAIFAVLDSRLEGNVMREVVGENLTKFITTNGCDPIPADFWTLMEVLEKIGQKAPDLTPVGDKSAIDHLNDRFSVYTQRIKLNPDRPEAEVVGSTFAGIVSHGHPKASIGLIGANHFISTFKHVCETIKQYSIEM